jgi:hypothetical protein
MSYPEDNKIHHRQVEALENCSRSPLDIHGLDTSKIEELFQNHGYNCKPAGNLRGISGVLHDFDFVCTKVTTGEKLVVQSLLNFQGDMDKFDVEIVKLRLSTYDCSPDVCLVVTGAFADHIKQMAGLYRLTIIDGSSGENPYEQIESLLKLQA